MDWQLPMAALPSLVAGLFQVALAVLLLRVGRGRRTALALALLLVSGGCASILAFAFGGFTHTYPTAVTIALTQVFWTMNGWLWACFAMMLLAERTRVHRVLQSFPTYLFPALTLGALALWRPDLAWDYSGFLSATLVIDAPAGSFPFSHPGPLLLVNRISDLTTPALAVLLAWWALRREESEQWSSILVISLAAGGTWAFAAGTRVEWMLAETTGLVRTGERLATIAGSLASLALCGLLMHEGMRGRPERRGLARVGAAFVLAMAILGAWIEFAPSHPLMFSAFLAGGMLTFPLVATYALLRHRLLGLDVKLRFAISRSTIAAAFVAAFFVASEGAQILFGQGNEWVGLFAAGSLVFAIAPLQRAAERLAERAVPLHRHESHGSPDDRHSRLFLRVARALLLEGPMTPQKEAHLAEIAHELGISYPDALRLRRSLEEEGASA